MLIDEFRIWNKSISATKQQGFINQPLEGDALTEAETTNGLQVYYQFNQSGGDATDATSNGNTGVRLGFGPDGDAWTLSTGVFSLNFDESSTEVTSRYFVNYKEPFRSNGRLNESQGDRFKQLASWSLDGEVVEGGITTCAHVVVACGNHHLVVEPVAARDGAAAGAVPHVRGGRGEIGGQIGGIGAFLVEFPIRHAAKPAAGERQIKAVIARNGKVDAIESRDLAKRAAFLEGDRAFVDKRAVGLRDAQVQFATIYGTAQ